MTFDYKDGTIIKDKRLNLIRKLKIAKSKKTKKKKEVKNPEEQVKDYIINRETNKFHLRDNECKSFEKADCKYINETKVSSIMMALL
ncbi:MAG: hypothetical protein Q4G05_06495 [Clostridia bacterium]|nr:hypothetical protein [Clostridia bacterium]